MKSGVEVLVDARASLAEGPTWHAERSELWWVDIPAGEVHRADPATDRRGRERFEGTVGALAVCGDGSVLVAAGDTIRRISGDGVHPTVATIPKPDPRLRFNDGAVDPAGRFVVGTTAMTGTRPGAAGLWSFQDHRARLVRTGLTISNGLGWLPDGDLIHVDTPTQRIDRFEYDCESGSVGKRRSSIAIDPAMGAPDGVAIDEEGAIWVALWGGSAVHRYIDGRLDAIVAIPASLVTSVAFFGARLEYLAITTAALDSNGCPPADGDMGGAIFIMKPEVAGLPVPACLL